MTGSRKVVSDVACSLLVLQPQRQNELLDVPGNEDGDEDISGTQFVCETVIRSLTLEEEPERKPQRRTRPNLRRHDGEFLSDVLVLKELLIYPIDILQTSIILLIFLLIILQFITLLAFRRDRYR